MSNLKSWSRRVSGNQNLGRSGRQTASKGAYTGLQTHTYDTGTEQKVVIPLFQQGDVLAPVIVSAPIHKVNKVGSLELKRKDGVSYSIYNIRSNHPFAQGDAEIAKELAERGEVCVFHELTELQRAKAWKTINEKYGDNIAELPESERKDVNRDFKKEENNYIVRPSYMPARGDYPARNITETYILMFVYDTEVEIQKNHIGVEKEVQKVILDENGKPKYKPVLFSLSAERGKKFEDAINNAIDSEIVTEDDLHPYVEFAGTEDEKQVLIGWVDFTLKFPHGTKMESGRDLSIIVPARGQRATTKELVDSLQDTDEGAKLVAQVSTYFNGRPALKVRTRAEQLEVLSPEALRTYNELREEFPDVVEKVKTYFDEKVFPRVLEQQAQQSDTAEEATPEVEEAPAPTPTPEVVEEAKPKARTTKTASNANVMNLLNKIQDK